METSPSLHGTAEQQHLGQWGSVRGRPSPSRGLSGFGTGGDQACVGGGSPAGNSGSIGPLLGRLLPAGQGRQEVLDSSVDGHRVVDGVAVDVGLLNLGAGGWHAHVVEVEEVMATSSLHLCALVETHLAFGSSFGTTSRVSVSSYSRQVVDLTTRCGGVALAVLRTGTSPVVRVEVLTEQCSRLADVAWFRVTLASSVMPLFVAVFYLPPETADSLCRRPAECRNVECARVHPIRAVEELSATAAMLSRDGIVVVLGDGNASVPQWLRAAGLHTTASTVARGLAMYNIVVGGEDGLVLVNAAEGAVQATRRDPHHRHLSQLDWVLCSRHHDATVSRLDIDADASFSDHFLLSTRVTVRRRPRQEQLLPAERRARERQVVAESEGVLQSVRDMSVAARQWKARARLTGRDGVGGVELAQRREAFRAEVVQCWQPCVDDDVRVWMPYEQQVEQFYRLSVKHGVVLPLRDRGARRAARAVLDAESPSLEPEWSVVADRVRVVRRRLATLLVKEDTVDIVGRREAMAEEVEELKAELKLLRHRLRGFSRQLRAVTRSKKWTELRTAVAQQRHQLAADLVSAMVADHDTFVVHRRGCKHGDGELQPELSERVEALWRWWSELSDRYQPPDVCGEQEDGDEGEGDGDADLMVSEGRFPELSQPVSVDEVKEALRSRKGKAAGTGVPMCELKAWACSEELLQVVADFLSDVFLGHVSIPELWTQLTMHPIPKPGLDPNLPSSCRCIALGDTLGRVLQTVVTRRLLLCVKQYGLLHPSQGGFVLDSSNEFVVWSSHVVLEQCRRRGVPVWQLFVDVRRAFGSCRHKHVLQALRDVGIGGAMFGFIKQWLKQTTIMTCNGAIALMPIAVLSGLAEGNCFSPILWALFLDPLARRIADVCSADTVPVVAGQLWPMDNFADDMSMLLTSREQLDVVVAELESFATERHLEINLNKGKTEVMYRTPLDAHGVRLRTRVVDRVNRDVTSGHGGVRLRFGDTPVVQTVVYGHLGRQVHADGGRDSRVEHMAMVRRRLGMWRHRMARGGVRDMPPDLGRLLLITRVRASWTYGMAMWADSTAVRELGMLDMQIQKHVILRSRYLSDSVVQAVLGVRSAEAEWHASIIRLALQLAALPDDHARRGILEALWREWQDCVDSGDEVENEVLRKHSWWGRLHAVLVLMDETEDSEEVGVESPYAVTGVQWVEDMAFVVDTSNDAAERHERLGDMKRNAMLVIEWWDWRRNCMETNSKVALAATAELLNGPLAEAPFVSYPRSKANMLRVRLRGGTRHVLRLFQHVVLQCPWCGHGDMTVPHLLRDCVAWSVHRERMREAVKPVAVAAGMMPANVRTERAFVDASEFWSQQWYLLMVGAPVSKYLLRGPMFVVAQQGRAKTKLGPVRVPGVIRSAYGEVLRVAGVTLCKIVEETQRHFGVRAFELDEVMFEAKMSQEGTSGKRRRRRGGRRRRRRNRKAGNQTGRQQAATS